MRECSMFVLERSLHQDTNHGPNEYVDPDPYDLGHIYTRDNSQRYFDCRQRMSNVV
jgi:hypothetical protein